MKTLLALFVFGSFSFAFAMEMQDSTQNQNKEQKQIQEQNQQKNQGDEFQIRDKNRLHSGDQFYGKEGNKRGKDVFIDKDGDGIADTRAGGMSLEKIRKRTRSGQQGSGGHGGSGNGGNGSSGNGGGK
jgi:hypothetical protein